MIYATFRVDFGLNLIVPLPHTQRKGNYSTDKSIEIITEYNIITLSSSIQYKLKLCGICRICNLES